MVRKKSSPAHFWALFGPNLPPFRPKTTFWLISSERFIEFCWFWYRNLSYGLLLENWCLQSGKNLAPPILGPFWSKFVPFRPKISILAYISRTVHWILLIFGIETYLKVFFWKNWCLLSVKNIAKIRPFDQSTRFSIFEPCETKMTPRARNASYVNN